MAGTQNYKRLPVAEAASVDPVLNEEVDIIIGTHICAFLAHGYVHRVRRLRRHPLDHGWPNRRLRGGHLFHHPSTLMPLCFRPITIDVCGLGGSTYPAGVQSSRTLADITGNLTCVVEHVGSMKIYIWNYTSARIVATVTVQRSLLPKMHTATISLAS
ncbi:hypothetical protein EV702DRAFT_1108482 [Suillus placidus]|uniref:Uncharacterized protein n=1 Tax=Suillus placidus TaxID=48579 RepID=A0A9P7D2H5_9AGAM|nr:hypothetical protein EV702DRAFT_1108482 [Suillus placidus]